MKKILTTFTITKHKKIELFFPDIANKINYFYNPTKNLHKFDEIMISLQDNNISLKLYKNTLDGALLSLHGQLKRSRTKLIDLPSTIEVGQMVYALNESDKENPDDEYKNVNFSNFWVWSSNKGPQTFMYTSNGDLYLEIGQIYPWLYSDPEPNDPHYISYENFIKNYKPILVHEISPETVDQWLEQCNALLKEIE
jgi:hypothetical protein